MNERGKETEVPFDRLVEWAEGRLPEKEARAVEERLANADEATRAEAEWLKAFLRASESVVLDGPPAEVRDELMRRFESREADEKTPGPLRRLVATLAFDGPQPAFGVRSAAGSTVQLVYTTDAADIALNVLPRPRNGHLDLAGQVFPTDGAEPDTFSVQLLSGVDEVGLATTDELGEFDIEAVEPGTYQMLVSNGRVEILISPIELSA